MNRRKIGLLIILSVLASAVATTASAAMTDIANSPHKNAIEQMVELGVLCGHGEGLFCPDDNLTRAQAAKVAMFLTGFDEQDATQAEALPQAFDDVYAGMGDHEWALGWINLAAREGIIEGYGDGKYGPGDNLQMAQWAAILVRVLGYETGELEWPTGYDRLAGELGLTESLDYVSESHIKRDQMARFSANAVFNVERSDGSKIIDLLIGKADDTSGDTADRQSKDTNISVVVTPEVLPEGGGQTATITVKVTDKTGNPVEGTKVCFWAFAFEAGEKHAQLSPSETMTDASGKAVATYTTLAADDKKIVELKVGVFNNDPVIEEFGHYAITAANQGALIHGVVKDPYTGAPLEDVLICFGRTGTMETIGCLETDEQGRYRAAVPVGTYSLDFQRMPVRDSITVEAKNPGQTYTVDNNKGILRGVVTGVSPGKRVMAMVPGFRPGYDDHTLQAEVQNDGSFIIALAPDTYELVICETAFHFETVTVKSGQVTDIGTVRGAR